MANKFQVNTLLLSGQAITANTSDIFLNGNKIANANDTGQFITTAQTGHVHSQYALVAGTGQFISTAQTGQFAPSGMTGQFVTTAQTGHIHSQYLTSVTPVGVTSVSTSGIFISGSIGITGMNGVGVSFSGQFIRISGNSLQTGQFVDSSKTGQFVDSSKTGIFALISKTASFSNPDGIQSGAYSQAVWRCNREATMTGFYGYRVGGSGAVVNAYKNSVALAHLAVNMNLISTGAWIFSGTIANASYARGDTLILSVLSVTGLPTAITIQGDFV